MKNVICAVAAATAKGLLQTNPPLKSPSISLLSQCIAYKNHIKLLTNTYLYSHKINLFIYSILEYSHIKLIEFKFHLMVEKSAFITIVIIITTIYAKNFK